MFVYKQSSFKSVERMVWIKKSEVSLYLEEKQIQLAYFDFCCFLFVIRHPFLLHPANQSPRQMHTDSLGVQRRVQQRSQRWHATTCPSLHGFGRK